MKKFLSIISLLVIALIWVINYSTSINYSLRSNNYLPDSYRYGDLYNLSYLANFKEPTPNCKFISQKKENSSITLNIIGDSFTFKNGIESSWFNSDSAYFSHWDNPAPKPQKNTKNVLIIETVERAIRAKFGQKYFYFETIPMDEKEEESWYEKNINSFEKNIGSIEERLILSLFNWNFVLPVREFKAKIDHYFFDRQTKSYVLGSNKNNIFYFDEADKQYGYSSFASISDYEINLMITNLIKTENHFLKLGFDQVIFSFIPNKVTIMEPKLHEYNRLIERLESKAKGNRLHFISMFDSLNNPKMNYYYKSDSHWNCQGKGLWISKINDLLKVKHNNNNTN